MESEIYARDKKKGRGGEEKQRGKKENEKGGGGGGWNKRKIRGGLDGFVAGRVFPSVIKICIDVSARPARIADPFFQFPASRVHEDLRATPARPVNSRRGRMMVKNGVTSNIRTRRILSRQSCVVTCVSWPIKKFWRETRVVSIIHSFNVPDPSPREGFLSTHPSPFSPKFSTVFYLLSFPFFPSSSSFLDRYTNRRIKIERTLRFVVDSGVWRKVGIMGKGKNTAPRVYTHGYFEHPFNQRSLPSNIRFNRTFCRN